MDRLLKIKLSFTNVILLALAILFSTVFRVSFLLVYPLIVIFLFYFFRWKVDLSILFFLLLVGLFWLLSFRNGFFIKYNLVSLYYFVPFFLLVFAKPVKNDIKGHFDGFMKALAAVTILNDVFGIAQYIRNPGDDNFVGLYGQFTVSQNGLSLLNAVLFFYYLLLFFEKRRKKYAFLAGFFIVCSIMGFYGAGMIAFIASMVIYYMKFTLKKLIKFLFLMSVVILSIYFVMKIISPKTLQYNINIIKKFWTASTTNAPRKLKVFYNYGDAYLKNPVDLFLGSGPGTFNSRSAFMVGSPTYFNMVQFIKSEEKPYYFFNYAYPLWNEQVITWYDGFMNQPFTSILALLGEYGLISTVFLFIFLIRNYRRVNRQSRNLGYRYNVSIPASIFKFTSIFTLSLIVIDNYIEYPEIIALLITISKLSEQSIKPEFSDA